MIPNFDEKIENSHDKLNIALGQVSGNLQSPDLLEHLALFDVIAAQAPNYSSDETQKLILLAEQIIEKNYGTEIIKKIIECKKEAFLNKKSIWLWACSYCSIETVKYIESSGLPIDYEKGALNAIINHQHDIFKHILLTNQLVLTEALLSQAIMRHLLCRPIFTTVNLLISKAEDIIDLSGYSLDCIEKMKHNHSKNEEALKQLQQAQIALGKAIISKQIKMVGGDLAGAQGGEKDTNLEWEQKMASHVKSAKPISKI